MPKTPNIDNHSAETEAAGTVEEQRELLWWETLGLKEDPTGKEFINPNDSAEFTVLGKADSPIAAQHPIKVNYRQPEGGLPPHDTEMSVEYFNASKPKA